MASLLRSARSIRPITTIRPSIARQEGRRLYGQSTYGDGETKPEAGRSKSTEDREHPGAPPPNVNKNSSSRSSSSSTQQSSGENKVPSNKAKPTITDGHQSANMDPDGKIKPDVPEDVKRHNAEVGDRYDKPYNQIKE
ncbi:hypothetical protein BJX99DRAFT_240605 [Aspergillus californicus]